MTRRLKRTRENCLDRRCAHLGICRAEDHGAVRRAAAARHHRRGRGEELRGRPAVARQRLHEQRRVRRARGAPVPAEVLRGRVRAQRRRRDLIMAHDVGHTSTVTIVIAM